MKLAELAGHIGAQIKGDGEVSVTAVASLTEASETELSFISEKRYASQVVQSKAAAIIVAEDFDGETSAALLLVADVNLALEQVLSLFAPPPDLPSSGIDLTAHIAETVRLGEKVAIGPRAVISDQVEIGEGSYISAGCYLGANVKIGRNCVLAPNVTIRARCELGNNVIINANSSIGTDGFGYRAVDGKHQKIPHIGIVVIEDDVEIGSNSCVDRAKFGKTIIGRGTKIDNLVQIAHNVHIGENCIIVAQVGIAGSCRLGNYVIIGGQVAVKEHTTIGDGAMAGAQCGVISDVEPGARVLGSPSRPIKSFFREVALTEKLPEMAKEIKRLRKQLDGLGNSKDNS
ncbi:MAG: UDP-3-O-(3-hydroxymyristoyl)glucosamine N-acyltransferase [Planctomycetes bacterium]|nr:UDP-3-O-(3-hydroxymyristoyl)glucosamine N-acyltransferase [Planctomycetota bacterium]